MSAAPAWLGVATLGGLGALLRFGVQTAVHAARPRTFPLGILLVNISGSFALGLLIGATVTGTVMLVVGTGLLGGYTTFSTWMVDSVRLAEGGAGVHAWLNLGGSMVAGLAAAGSGSLIGGWL